ncbi:hypothetical protein BpHYR1_024926 [Brachionus plicatilis]|uniref:Uncharacterized protein n=1 Tax=Brachionus plicatilis TaxID=10195 RepID=A0A3M7QN89_BRAPC|nr:hypothetical protein BpHYR1_024926 [Brachionus plicatilis]
MIGVHDLFFSDREPKSYLFNFRNFCKIGSEEKRSNNHNRFARAVSSYKEGVLETATVNCFYAISREITGNYVNFCKKPEFEKKNYFFFTKKNMVTDECLTKY